MRTLLAISVLAFTVSAARAQDAVDLAAQQAIQNQILFNQQLATQQTQAAQLQQILQMSSQALNNADNSSPTIRKPFQLKLRSSARNNRQLPVPPRNSNSTPTAAAAPNGELRVPYPYATNTVPYPYAANAAR